MTSDAGQATVDGTVSATTNDQFWFSNFRVGDAPEFFDGVQFSKDPAALDQPPDDTQHRTV